MGQERTEEDFVCPCGRGTVTHENISFDNGYSKDINRTSCRCADCRLKYRFKFVTTFSGSAMKAWLIGDTGAAIDLAKGEFRDGGGGHNGL